MTEVAELWSYLSAGPLLWLTCTVAAYLVSDMASARMRRAPWASPVLMAVAILAPILWLTETPYAVYFEGAQFIHFMLGPATVALAAPLHAHLKTVIRSAGPLLAALAAGSTAAAFSAVGLAVLFDLPIEVIASLSPKSTTAPVALGIAEALGGIPSLTATLVLLTGMIGALAATPLLNALRVTDWRARGFAVGVAAHGLGAARAFQVNETAGAFAGIGMALNAVLTSVIAPLALLALL